MYTYTLFQENPQLMSAFLELLLCQTRGNIIVPHNESVQVSHRDIPVRKGLVRVSGCLSSLLCFDFAYVPLFKKNVYFRKLVIEYWPFIVDENQKLYYHDQIYEKIEQMKKQESSPKSARKYKSL
jgi:hypothetical protein